MSTDITLDATPERRPLDFDDFVRTELAALAQAVAISVTNPDLAARAVEEATVSVHSDWRRMGYDDEPATQIFARAIAACAEDEPTAPELAIVAATHWLDWSTARIARALGISEAAVGAALDKAIVESEQREALDLTSSAAALDSPVSRLRSNVRGRATESAVTLPDAVTIQQRARRRRARVRSVILVGSLAALALVGTLFAGSRSNTMSTLSELSASPETEALAETTASPQTTASATEQAADQLAVLEPVPGDVRPPQLVTASDTGEFAGARSPTFRSPRSATFSTSSDGLEWDFASRWPLGDYEYLNRFEQINGRYFAVVDNALAPNPPNPIKIGVSDDLVSWNELVLPLPNTAPTGLTYSAEITSLAAVDDVVAVVVQTDITVDYEALAIVESYTCGTTFTLNDVAIDLCNDATFTVTTPTGLPNRHRLFLSRDDVAFQQVQWPFDPNTEVTLSSSGSSMHAISTTGQRLATSQNGDDWQSEGTSPLPSSEVTTLVQTSSGDRFGLRRTSGDALQLFVVQESNASLVDLASVIGEPVAPTTIDAASGIAGWAVTVTDDQDRSWILFSADGATWRPVETDLPSSSEQRVFVGDNELLVRSMTGTGPLLTRLPVGN